MSLDGKSTEPSTARGCSNCCNYTTLDSDSGAGANAGSQGDMTFVGANPLSELVWSPQKGLCIKYAGGSFSKEKPCIVWCPEANNIVVSSSTDRATDNTCLITTSTTLNITEGARKEIPINFLSSGTGVMQLSLSSHERERATSDQPEKMETMLGTSIAPGKEGLQCDQEEADMLSLRVGNSYSSMKQIISAGEDDGQNLATRTVGGDFPVKLEAGASTNNVHEVAHSLENEGNIKSDPVPLAFHCLEKHESAAENDLRSSHGRKGTFVATNSVQSESSGKVKIVSPQGHGLVAEGKMPSGTDSPSSSRIRRYRLKGKGKALSDGKTSHERGSSHESVESCGSAVLYSAGKKGYHFDQNLIVGSKTLKRRIQDSPGSSSHIRQDSSFMNWISNMMKGFSSSRESTVPSLALALVEQDQDCKVPETRFAGLNKKSDSGGFQNFFDSLYRPKRKAQDIFPLNHADQNEECRAIELDKRVSNDHASPKICHAETDGIYKLFKLPNNNSHERALQNSVSQVFQARDSSKNLPGDHHDIGITSSMGNKGSVSLDMEMGQDGKISNLSHDKGEGFELSFDGKANQAYGSVGDPMASLWISRFIPKVPVPFPHQNACNQVSGEAPIRTTGDMTLKYRTKQLSLSNSNKELQQDKNLGPVLPFAQTCVANARNSLAFSKEKVVPEDPDDILQSPEIKQWEIMPSVLERRLNIFNHIALSDASPAARHLVDLGAHSVSPGKLKFKAGNNCGRRLSDDGDCQLQAANALSTCDGNDPRMGKDFNRRQNKAVSSKHRNEKLLGQGIPSSSMVRKSSASSFTPLGSLLDQHLLDDPKSIFDSVKRLRLSRADVLKWTHSLMPLSCLDGFFLRLRLGKWDAGLGRAQYHVACITGVKKERMLQNPKFSISVDVGGISCLVESQYISNQDFLEDELKAWWTSTSKRGGKVPSQEELRLKLEEKKMLGL